MKASTLEVLIWVLIYGGLIGVGLGLSVRRTDPVLGTIVLAVGAAVVLAGAALVYVRSRTKDTPQPNDNKTP